MCFPLPQVLEDKVRVHWGHMFHYGLVDLVEIEHHWT